MRINKNRYFTPIILKPLSSTYSILSRKVKLPLKRESLEKISKFKPDPYKFAFRVYIVIALILNSAETAGMCASVFSELHIKLDLPIRIVRLLHKEGINTVEKLANKTPRELLRLPSFGDAFLHSVETALAKKNLYLKASARSLDPNNISVLKLSVRSWNALQDEGINTIKKLADKTPEELLGIRNLGIGSLMEIEKTLANRDLSLKASARSLDPNDISALSLSVRTQNALRAEGINSIEKLADRIPLELLRKIILEKEQK
ncbi:MAG: hypothetical protein OXJ52_02555 [Oligoflexia bacterium]|nr:hypothetical protein [Oligoflexia bacterium]